MTLPHRSLEHRWLRCAALYFVIAVGLGLHMGASGNHMLMYVHVHTNLLGWVSCALFGLLCGRLPALGRGPAARAQFWLHNLGLPAMMIAYAGRLMTGAPFFQTLIVVGSTMVGLAVLTFASNLWFVLGASSRAAVPATTESPTQ